MSTEQPRPLQGYRETQETKKDAPVDPKKFQEELSKVRESDESQQRSKRNLKRSEEEGEEEESAKKELIQASGALFALFMKKSLNQSLLTPQTPQDFRGSQAPTTTSKFTIQQDNSPPLQGQAAPSPEAPLIELGSFEAPKQLTEEPFPPPSFPKQTSSEPSEPTSWQPPQPAIGVSSPPPTLQEPVASKASQGETPSPERIEKKEVEDTSLYGRKGKSKAQIEKEKEVISPKVKLEEKTQPLAPQKEKKETPPVEEKPVLVAKEAQKVPLGTKALEESTPKTAQTPIKAQITEEKSLAEKEKAPQVQETQKAQAPVASKPKEEKGKEKEGALSQVGVKETGAKVETEGFQEQSDKKEKQKEEELAQLPSMSPVPLAQIAPLQQEAPVYATLPPGVYELFEKMVGMMTIEQFKGVTTTTVTINMKNSVLDGAQIIIDHYSTAPNAFNITIAASPQGQQLIDANLEKMVSAFQASKLSFEVNLRRPVLLDTYQALGKNEKVERDEDSSQEKKK